MKRKSLTTALLAAALLFLSGCANLWIRPQSGDAQAAKSYDEVPAEMTDRLVNGTVDHVWAEHMVDQVRVPAQVDPNNVYYRPSHETVVEIRHERYQEVQFPGK